MLFVHDTSVIRAGQRVAAVKGGNLPGQKRQQPVMNVPVHEHIIRRDAGLPGVQVFAEGEALCRQGEVCGLVNDARAFAAQLQRHGREPARGLFHHQPANGHTAREKDIVEFLFQQGFVFRASALHDGDMVRREAAFHKLLQNAAGGRRVRAGLEHRAVARRDRADQRVQREHERIIPRAHHQRHAQRLGHDEAAGGELRQRGFGAPGTHQAVQMLFHIGQLAQYKACLAHIALKGRFVQVLLQGGADIGLPGRYRLPQRGQRAAAESGVFCRACIEKSPLRMKFEEGLIKISCSTAIGKAYDEIRCEQSGDDVEIGFNSRYMLDALKASEGDEIRVLINGPLSPIKLMPVEGDAFVFLVLPVRLKSE